MLYIEKLQQQIDEQLVELANLRDQLSQEKILNQNQETYLNLLEKETIETFANEEGRIEGICKSCESWLLSMANGGWEVVGYEFRGEWIRDSD